MQFVRQYKDVESHAAVGARRFQHVAEEMRSGDRARAAATNENTAPKRPGLPEDFQSLVHRMKVDPLQCVEQFGSVLFRILHSPPGRATQQPRADGRYVTQPSHSLHTTARHQDDFNRVEATNLLTPIGRQNGYRAGPLEVRGASRPSCRPPVRPRR